MKVTPSRTLLAALSLCALSHGQASIITNYTAEVNDRFANDPAFIADDYDLSGVSLSFGRWATMISPNVFLSAAHLAPGSGGGITFHADNDPLGPNFSTTIGTTSERVGETDLWLGVLSDPLPSNYAFYDFATQRIANDNPGDAPDSWAQSPYYMADALIMGRSPGSYADELDVAVGQNRLEEFFDGITVSGGGVGDGLGSPVDGEGDADFLPYELDLVSGDSGGPVFVDVDGELTIVGINWFSSDDGGNQLNGYTYVGNYAPEIQAFLELHSVPEPSDFALGAGLAAVAAVIYRRRKAKAVAPAAECGGGLLHS